MKINLKDESHAIKFLVLFISLTLLASSVITGLITGELSNLFNDWELILFSPGILTTDYFLLGGICATLFNAGICGLACTIIIFMNRRCRKGELSGFFLVIAHCFYGLNFLSMWPPILAIWIYCKAKNHRFRDNLPTAFFATAFGPFVSELLFRYDLVPSETFQIGDYTVYSDGIIGVVLLIFILAFAIPAMLPGATLLHRGYNLYNAGLAFGVLGLFLSSLMYKTMGMTPQGSVVGSNAAFLERESSYHEFANIYFILLFLVILLMGMVLSKGNYDSFWKLCQSDGLRNDFLYEYGTGATFINIALYGFMMLLYFDLIMLLPNSAGFTGPTMGVMFAALTFSASGQHPRIVLPVIGGYVLFYAGVSVVSYMLGRDMSWNLANQGYINAIAFSTGLCPFSGRYGWKAGVAAGAVAAAICTSTSSIHAGLVLYNGGFTAGLTAIIVLPILDHYFPKESSES